MQCGVLIYRDARLVEGWPMHEIPKEQVRRGDALYFPGHIALYLGEGRYIHSTGAAGSGGVVLNSLDPDDPLYREDLVKSCMRWEVCFEPAPSRSTCQLPPKGALWAKRERCTDCQGLSYKERRHCEAMTERLYEGTIAERTTCYESL